MQAENAVLYPLLSSGRLGDAGKQWAAPALAVSTAERSPCAGVWRGRWTHRSVSCHLQPVQCLIVPRAAHLQEHAMIEQSVADVAVAEGRGRRGRQRGAGQPNEGGCTAAPVPAASLLPARLRSLDSPLQLLRCDKGCCAATKAVAFVCLSNTPLPHPLSCLQRLQTVRLHALSDNHSCCCYGRACPGGNLSLASRQNHHAGRGSGL